MSEKKDKSWVKAFAMLAILTAGIFIGRTFFSPAPNDNESAQADHAAHKQPTMYTCPMHPAIMLPDADARCPICSMTLVEASTDSSGSPDELVLSENAARLADIETTPVIKSAVTHVLRLQGEIFYDETATAQISSWVSGRIETLYADYTGMAVRKGDHMVRLYSPQLLSAQTEMLQARKALGSSGNSSSKLLAGTVLSNYDASVEKLRLLGLSLEQIQAIEASGQADPFITINTPVSGIVTERLADEGQYIETGTSIYSIAKPDQLWLVLDAYEADLPWIRLGNRVNFTLRSIPGKTFSGTISFVSPVLDPQTHTAQVRINISNPDGRISPGMLATAHIHVQMDASGKAVANINYSGKYICPMHPSVIFDSAGKCPICRMDTESAESLGYTAGSPQPKEAITIPESAVLHTGSRSIVYVKKTGTETPVFQLRNITLGPKSNKGYIVLSGLEPGELVVSRGTFKIDSERQLRNKPAMMAQIPTKSQKIPATPEMDMALPEDYAKQLNTTIEFYLDISGALSDDNFETAKAAAAKALRAANELSVKAKQANNSGIINDIAKMRMYLAQLSDSKNINIARELFSPLSQHLENLLTISGNITETQLYLAQCPMAFNNAGAKWISSKNSIENPYFGAAMYKCGTILQTIAPRKNNSNGGHSHDR